MRKRNFRDDQDLIRKFAQEMSNLKRLSHHHLVKMVGSYTDHKAVAYLMEPVGECNLMTYLCMPRAFIEERIPSLRKYFGCLANAVAYLHRQRVRHRDLKPQNIIVKNHNVYIADFGNALDWSKRGRDTTNDSSLAFSEPYVAPEVARRSSSSRSSSSDIWSLGVVFLDMLTVLRGSTIRTLRIFLETHGTRHQWVWGNIEATNQWFEEIRKLYAGPESDNEPLIWIKDMTQSSPSNRPSSGALASQIRSSSTLGHFIGHCCTVDDEMEGFPSPLSSNHSECADLHIDDMPPELSLGGQPYRSFAESIRQNNIERWLGESSGHHDVISGVFSEPPDIFDGDIVDVPYDIVDDPTIATIVPVQESFESQKTTSQRFVTIDECEGYDVVEDESDDEAQMESRGVGYEVTDESSESEATIRLEVNPSAPMSPSELGRLNALTSDQESEETSTKTIQAVHSRLDALPKDPVEVQVQEAASESMPRSLIPESSKAANLARPSDVTAATNRTNVGPNKIERNMAGISAVGPQNRSQEGVTEKPPSDSKLRPLNATNLARLAKANERPQNNRGTKTILADEPQISPSVYMQEVWEAASSAATSAMSKRTQKALGGLGIGLAWQDRTAHFLEKYVKAGSAAAVRELLKAGCNPGTKKNPRIRPLMLAVKGGSQRHNKCLAALLDYDADVNAREEFGKTALHYAIEHQNFHGYTNLIRDLLEAGADPNNKDKSGDFPLLQILYGGSEPLAKHKRDALACLLRKEFATNVSVVPPGTRNMPLHLAVRRKDPWAVSMLLTRGAQVNEPNGSGMTPLMLAANAWSMKMSSGQNEVLRFLLEGGVNINERDDLGKTALHYAASNLCEVAVSLLLSKGADPTIKDAQGYEACFYAGESAVKVSRVPEAHAAIMMMLFGVIGHGSLETVEGECAVVTAVVQSKIEIAKILFKHGAKVDLFNESTQRCPLLHISLRKQDFSMAQVLIDNGAYLKLEDVRDRLGEDACASLTPLEFTNLVVQDMRTHAKRFRFK